MALIKIIKEGWGPALVSPQVPLQGVEQHHLDLLLALPQQLLRGLLEEDRLPHDFELSHCCDRHGDPFTSENLLTPGL